MKRTLFLTLCLLASLAACQQAPSEPTITPPVSEVEPTPAASAEETAAEEAAVVDNPTAVAPPETPTPEPTAAATETPEPTPEPTLPPPAPVNSVSLERVAEGFFKPLYVTHAGDERLFVVQQHGVISIIADGVVLEQPFLDIDPRVNSNANEQGLLGLAFHPDYATNGQFYLNYSGASGETVIARFSVDPANPNLADPNSEEILLTIPQPYPNHNGGQIAFGPDGFLYIGMGDGGSQNDPANNAQDNGTLLGTILRIDVDGGTPYAVPASNPFVGNDSQRNEIWAYGLRNPWRFSFDRETGDLFIADVGQNQYEEISFQPADSSGAENYGWRIFEGNQCYLDDCSTPNLIPPIAEYSHAEGHCSVTGGYVYRGDAYPELRGNYFYADYCSGVMWRLFQNADGSWDSARVGQTGFLVSSFGEDVNGEIYVANQQAGQIYRLVP